MNKQKKKIIYIYIFNLISWKNLVAAFDCFLGKISFSRNSSLSRDWIVCSCLCLVLFFLLLVYSKLHINKLTTRTVILVRIYLIDTCAVFLSLSLFATKCYLSFCLVFFRVQPQKIFFCQVCVYFSHGCSVRALFLFFSRQFK